MDVTGQDPLHLEPEPLIRKHLGTLNKQLVCVQEWNALLGTGTRRPIHLKSRT